MEKKDLFTKILAITGFVLVWLTILAPVFFAIMSLVRGGGFRFDYLMPAELFIGVLAGGFLLLWAALRARSHVKWISWALILAVLMLVGGQSLAVVTGLADGTSGEGWFPVVLGMIVLYDLLVVALGVGGWCLIRELYGKKKPTKS
ncbi:MAG: hypothetical protein JXR32_05965 [Anaerolineaceae bacterium]|nr:hypothetical protein [Anaerolineaceae bacterium]